MFSLESKTKPCSLSLSCVIALEYNLSFSNLSGETSLHPVSIQIKENEISVDDVSCLYEKEGYDGIVEEVSVEENDVLVKFLHPICPSVYPHWPSAKDKC